MPKPAPSKRRPAKRTRSLKCHPIYLLFPELPKQELNDLAADIKEKGLFNPIVLYQGKILDGRNRYNACQIAGVEPRFVEWKGGSPLEWVVSENLVRRHLSSSQRAVLALDILPLLEQEAAQRQRLSGGRGKKVAKKLAKVDKDGGSGGGNSGGGGNDHLAGGGRDKKFHDWGQDKTEVEYLISRLTHPGDLIADPFCGGGTVPAACKSLGRRWLATEIDKTTALIARKRLAEM